MAKQKAKAAKPKAEAQPKEKKEAAKKLILKNSIHIPTFKDREHGHPTVISGGVFPAGTVVTRDIRRAYVAAQKRLGGTKPIEEICE